MEQLNDEVWTHVTQPLTSDGSAVNNVIREVSRVAFDAGEVCGRVI